jgi:hypothetical protein
MRARGGELLLVSHDLVLEGRTPQPTLEAVRRFAKERKIRAPIRIFDGDALDRVIEHFELPGPLPFTAAVNAAGEVVDRHEGGADRERLAELAQRALGGG